MATSATIKLNVGKLVSAGAPDSDIDEYIKLSKMESDYDGNVPLKTGLTPSTNEQKSGAIIDPKEAFVPRGEDIPFLVGSGLGGIVGGGIGGVPGAVAGAAVGGAGGRFISDVAKSKGFFGGKPSETGGELAGKVGMGAVEGAAGELIGAGAGKIIGKIAPFAESVTPQIAKQEASAARIGVELPLRARTESPRVQSMSRLAENAPFAGGKITAIERQATESIDKIAEDFRNVIGKDRSPEDMVRVVDNAIPAFEKRLKEVRNRLYSIPELQEIPLSPDKTIAVLREAIENKGGEFEPAIVGRLEKVLKNIESEPSNLATLSGGKTGSITKVGQMRNERTTVGDMVSEFSKPGNSGVKGYLEKLYGAMSDDIYPAVDSFSPEVVKALRKADAYNEGMMEKLQQPLIKALQDRAQSNPSKLYDVVFRKDNPTLVKKAREIFSPDEFSSLKYQWFNDILEKSSPIIEGNQIVSPPLLARNLKKYGETISEIVSDDKVLAEKLDDLFNVSEAMSRGSRIKSGSQTGFIVKNAEDVRNYLYAKLVSSKEGQKFLTTGTMVPANAVSSVVKPIAGELSQGAERKTRQKVAPCNDF